MNLSERITQLKKEVYMDSLTSKVKDWFLDNGVTDTPHNAKISFVSDTVKFQYSLDEIGETLLSNLYFYVKANFLFAHLKTEGNSSIQVETLKDVVRYLC